MTTSVAKARQTEQMMKMFDSHVKLGIQQKKSLLKKLKTQVKVTVERNVYKGPQKKKKDGTVKKQNAKKEVKKETKKPMQKVKKETKAVRAKAKKPTRQTVKKKMKAAGTKKKTKVTEVDEDDVCESDVSDESDVPPSDDTMGGDDDDSDMQLTTSESGGESDKPQEPEVPYHIIAQGKMTWEGKQNIKAYRMVWLDPETLEPMSESDATWEPASRLENDLTDDYARLVAEFEENATKMTKGRRKRMTERQMKNKKKVK
jgi:hypothetical protein